MHVQVHAQMLLGPRATTITKFVCCLGPARLSPQWATHEAEVAGGQHTSTLDHCGKSSCKHLVLDEASDAGVAYNDAIARFLGEQRPMKYIQTDKKGLFKRLFSKQKEDALA